MFRKIIFFFLFVILVSAKRFGINMINDIRYGERWERRNNKSNLPSSGINSDGPYGRYRGRSVRLEQPEPEQPTPWEKMIEAGRPPISNSGSVSGSLSSGMDRSFDSFSSRSWSAPSYSTPSYSTPSYSTYSYSFRGYYPQRPWNQNQQRSISVSDLSNQGHYKSNNVMNLSDPNASFSNPDLSLANFSR